MEFYPTPNITWKWFFFFFYKCRIFLMRGTFLGWLTFFFMTASSATFSKVVLRNYSIFQYFFMCLLLLPHFWASVDILAMLFTFQTIITIITNTCTNSFLPKYNTISILFQFLSVYSFVDLYEKTYDWLLNATECLVHELFDRQGPKFAWLITRKNSILLWSHSAKVFLIHIFSVTQCI